MAVCHAGGLYPRVVQEPVSEANVLYLVAAGIGLGMVTSATQWRHPEGVVFKPISDLNVPLRLELGWIETRESAMLRNFIDVVSAPDKAALALGLEIHSK